MQQLGNHYPRGEGYFDIEGDDNYDSLNSWAIELVSVKDSNSWGKNYSIQLTHLAKRVDDLCKRLENSPLDDAKRCEYQNILQLKNTIKTLKKFDKCRWCGPGNRLAGMILCTMLVGGIISSLIVIMIRQNK